MAQYDSAIALALKLLTKFGETSTLTRKNEGTPPDTDKPWTPGTVDEDEYDVKAVWLDFDEKRVDGDIVKAGDQNVYVAASGLAISPDASTDHIIRASGEIWSIVGVKTLAPNGRLILHTLHVRK